mgnify:CR=1 FL=1
MTLYKLPIDLGAPIPELKNSPIIGNVDDERELIEPEIPEERSCYFNDQSYRHGTHIKSDSIILLCDRGVWVETQTPEE